MGRERNSDSYTPDNLKPSRAPAPAEGTLRPRVEVQGELAESLEAFTKEAKLIAMGQRLLSV